MTVEAQAAAAGELPERSPETDARPEPLDLDGALEPAGVPAAEGATDPFDITEAPEPFGLAAAPSSAEPVIAVRQLENGIIEVALPPNREIEGPEARVAGSTVRTLADGKRVPVLLTISGVVGVSVEARQVYAGSIAASAFALVGESPVDRVIAHYLLRSKTETIPAQFFVSRTEALEWLRPYTSEK
ncbi:DUF7793 family protein [Arthrobacter sp. Hor0625]|uniref:DUF7793 family protein n=1 Tax=Arthrobacter sp. Hor0625 TaxID=3457358 RepID=UPI00403EDD1D